MSNVGYLAAFGGGVISFASPCVLPIVPGYLSVITGLDITAVRDGAARAVGAGDGGPGDGGTADGGTADGGTADGGAGGGGRRLGRIARDTGFFVAGFTAVFVLLGLTASALGQAALRDHVLLTRVLGVGVIAMGLYLAGSLVLRLPGLYGEARLQVVPSRLGPLAAPVAGAAFGFGWTPCIGPVLASVLTVAAARGSMTQGALLLLAYALGLAVPFLAAGLAFGRLAGTMGWVRRHFRTLTVMSASSIVGFGILLTMNRLAWITTQLDTALTHVGLGRLITLG